VEPIVESNMDPSHEPSLGSRLEPNLEPNSVLTVEPTVEPTVELIIEPTVEPTVELVPSSWLDSNYGLVRVQLSIFTFSQFESRSLSSLSSISKVRINASKRKITANDIISGREQILLNDVITTVMTILCQMSETSGIIFIVPWHLVDFPLSNHTSGDFMNFCSKDPLKTSTKLPESLYGVNDTVFFTDFSVEKGFVDVIDRGMFLSVGNNDIEELNWVEWGISFSIMELGFRGVYTEVMNTDNIVFEINRIINKAFIVGATLGLIDELLISKNNDVLVTSLVGYERNVFTRAMLEERPDWNIITQNDLFDDVASGSNNDRSSNVMIEEANSKNSFFSPIRITGAILFIFVVIFSIAIQIITQWKRKGDGLDIPIADHMSDDWSLRDISFASESESHDSTILTDLPYI